MYSIGSERGEGSGLAKGEAIKDTCQGDLPSSQVGVMCANGGDASMGFLSYQLSAGVHLWPRDRVGLLNYIIFVCLFCLLLCVSRLSSIVLDSLH